MTALLRTDSSTTVQLAFDYADLDSETRIVVQQKTGEIKDRIKRTANDLIEIGERLTEIKARLGHGRFGAWLSTEFAWSERTAQNLMNVADAFKSATVADLAIGTKALVALSSPSVPVEARQEAVELAANGYHVTHAEAKQIIAKHKSALDRVDPEPSSVPFSLFETEDEPTPETEDVSEAEGEPETATEFDLSPTATLQNEKNAEAWAKIISNYANLVTSIRRRGGIATLAKPWPKSKIRDASQICGDVIEAFTSYQRELKGLLK